jgi:hypothetical protein
MKTQDYLRSDKDNGWFNLGFSTREDYEQAAIKLAYLKHGEYGKRINLELLKDGKLNGKTFIDLTHPKALIITTYDKQLNQEKISRELEALNNALELSYNLLEFFNDSAEYEKSVYQTIMTSMISPILYFEIQGHYTLEVMRDKLINDPIGYFADKTEAERKAA